MKKRLCFVLLFVAVSVLPPAAIAGGPDAEIDAHVNGVQVGDDFITFALYGEVRFHVPKTREESKQATDGGNTHAVTLRFENRYLIVHRDKEPVPGVTVDWEELKERALSMRDKDARFQVWGAKITIERSMVTRVEARSVSFWEKSQG